MTIDELNNLIAEVSYKLPVNHYILFADLDEDTRNNIRKDKEKRYGKFDKKLGLNFKIDNNRFDTPYGVLYFRVSVDGKNKIY